ncbi:MAG: hypothetical protein IKE01_03935 [Clostridia bacterium]|nr:hypothetical protein [Clostridia bacterium]
MTEEQKKKYPRSYRFDVETVGGDRVFFKSGDDLNFEINDKLRTEVYKGMPLNLSVEEKALFIYFRICKLLKYDENFIYSNKLNKNQDYGTDFDKKKIEEIEPGSSIICSDFCRIYKKFLDELGPDLECVAFSYGKSNTSHWSVGFFTDRVSLEMDPIDIQDATGYSDLMGIKNGMWPVGIKPDTYMTPENKQYLVDIIDEIYTMSVGEVAKDYEDFIELLKEVPDTNYVSNSGIDANKQEGKSVLYEKIEAFKEMLRNRGITGNEAISTFIMFSSRLGFFRGEMNEFSFAWQRNDIQNENSKKHERICLIQGKDGSIHSVNFNQEINGHMVYGQDELKSALATGKIVYEDSKYQIPLEEK